MRNRNIDSRLESSRMVKKRERLYFFILIGLILSFVLHHKFIESTTVGYDNRYIIFVFLVPTMTGIVILAYFKKDFLKNRILEIKGIHRKLFIVFFYLIQGFLFSYLSLGLVSNATWDFVNKSTAEHNPNEIILCEITKFNVGTRRASPNIQFFFQGKHESLSVDYKFIGNYLKLSPDNYELELNIQKGIWNYYIVNEMRIKNNR